VKRALVLFTRDLRVHDHAALSAAVEIASEIVPLFVLDDALRYEHSAPVRRAFLLDSLGDVRHALRERGGDLAIRRGDTVEETLRVAHRAAASVVFVGADASTYAQRRQERLARACRRERGGERAARRRLDGWLRDGLHEYETARNELAREGTSRLSSYLHFGCISPAEVVTRARAKGAIADAFVRQLCWRDFYLQLLNANPHTAMHDLHNRDRAWIEDEDALAARAEGRTGYPIVDAAMRQLRVEGWVQNRGRLLVASFLTKTLGIDWRQGAKVFLELLVDGDVANNVGNWQWVAGTGVDSRPNRVFNPIAQAKRLDPQGKYVRAHVPELGELKGSAIHEPWRAPLAARAPEYPERIVDLEHRAARA
jgi:deoxyribodipyrimidine photolyase